MPKKQENSSIAQTTEEPAKTAEDVPRDLPIDSLSKNKAMDKVSAHTEDVPKVSEVLSSVEARVSEKVPPESTSVLHKSENTGTVEKEDKTSLLEGTGSQETNVVISGPPCAIAVTADVKEPMASVNPGGAVSTEDIGPSGST